MKCHLVRDLLPLYIEGDCSRKTERLVAAHIKTCEDCREMYDMMREPVNFHDDGGLPKEAEEAEEQKFRKAYYQRLSLKGAALFGGGYLLMLLIYLFFL
ncbi:zf-HC2 domain-containing protein [Bacillus licheniformis]|uniref:Anti-sigma-W factor RsiW n=2 Tax=Bacillus licheniformis TaxID=1402 RepID=A0AB37GRR7_BACLI|nr:zf-HC2 domain-containing protein [Bacillus licheniformis]QPR71737.1 zf-HC2 domain-containing protein [Bacillus licheniformis]